MNYAKSLASAVCVTGLLAAAGPSAQAVVVDDFESYTVGQNADVANPSVYTPVGPLAIGVISAGASTANVPSTNVLEQTANGGTSATRADGADIEGDATITFDFRITSGTSNVYLIDNTTGQQGTLIQFIDAGNGSQFFIQVSGGVSGARVYDALIDLNDWYRATIDVSVNPTSPELSSFAVSFYNLTDAVDVTPFAGTGTDLTQDDVVRLNRLQFETPSGSAQFDNLTVPEPASLMLLSLGTAAICFRRRRA